MRLGFISLIIARMLIYGLFLSAVFLSTTLAQFPRLEVKPFDTVTSNGSINNIMSIEMRNWEDTVAAFTLSLTTSHPDVVSWQIGSEIKEGTLIEGWELVSTSGSSEQIRISAMANTYPPPHTPGIGYPQVGEVPLVKFLFDMNPLPDTMTTSTIDVYIKRSINEFNFSDELGNTIGLAYGDTTYDTLYYNCIEWIGDECMTWEEVGGPPADTIVYDTILSPYLDTTQVRIWDGSIHIETCTAIGDINGDFTINLFDITYLIGYLYLEGPAPALLPNADTNCDCVVNIRDVTCLLSYLYGVGIWCEPCICELWESICGK